jgi:hypothetical protein
MRKSPPECRGDELNNRQRPCPLSQSKNHKNRELRSRGNQSIGYCQSFMYFAADCNYQCNYPDRKSCGTPRLHCSHPSMHHSSCILAVKTPRGRRELGQSTAVSSTVFFPDLQSYACPSPRKSRSALWPERDVPASSNPNSRVLSQYATRGWCQP